jgi:small subunit ribosomal protein S18
MADIRTKKVCYFCEKKVEPTYTDSQILRKFMNDRARIVASLRTGACSKHQRAITKEIKHARHLALLPFVAGV